MDAASYRGGEQGVTGALLSRIVGDVRQALEEVRAAFIPAATSAPDGGAVPQFPELQGEAALPGAGGPAEGGERPAPEPGASERRVGAEGLRPRAQYRSGRRLSPARDLVASELLAPPVSLRELRSW